MPPKSRRLTLPMRTALTYAALGTLWIILTDIAVELALDGPANITRAQIFKGLAFVLLSTCVVYVLALNNLRASRRDQRALWRALRDKDRANAEVAELSKAAAHDLKTPLRQIASYLELLDVRYRDQLDAEARAYITYAVDGVTQMNDHLTALLGYIHAGSRLQPTARLHDLVANAMRTHRARIAAEEGTLEVELRAADLDVPSQLELVLHHLIDNAYHFRTRHRPLHVHLRVTADDDFLQLVVRDNGVGISSEHHDEVFALFSRLGTTRRDGSVGIGLALCRKVAQSLGGTITLLPQTEAGSTFAVQIPVCPSPRRDDAKGVATSAVGAS